MKIMLSFPSLIISLSLKITDDNNAILSPCPSQNENNEILSLAIIFSNENWKVPL